MMWYCRVLAGSETFGQISQKRISFLGLFLILIIFLVSTVSCAGVSNETKYLNYAATEKSLFSRITFEYPETWNWTVDTDRPSANSGWMSSSNPELTEAYGGFVVIHTRPFESRSDAISAMEVDILRNLEQKKVMRAEVISDRVFEIDSYSSRQIITKQEPVIGTEVPGHGPLVAESVYILVENSYYIVNLSILESERYGEFGQGFDHMIETIRFLP